MSRSAAVNRLRCIIGEVYMSDGFKWHTATQALSPEDRDYLADIVDAFFAEDPVPHGGAEVKADRWWQPKPPAPDPIPCPEGFHWIGQASVTAGLSGTAA